MDIRMKYVRLPILELYSGIEWFGLAESSLNDV